MQRTFLFVFISFFISNALVSQQSNQYSFTNYGVENGLAPYNTGSVVQDETGYSWIGNPGDTGVKFS